MKNEILERIKKIGLFSDFKKDEERLNKFSSKFKIEKFKTGEKIIKEGELGDKLYILNKGTVRILKSTVYNDNYTVTLLVSDSNIFFGEIALIDSDKRSATVIAESNCEVYSLDRKTFVKICESDPYMGYKMILHIAKRIALSLRKMNTDVITLFEALVNEVRGEF